MGCIYIMLMQMILSCSAPFSIPLGCQSYQYTVIMVPASHTTGRVMACMTVRIAVMNSTVVKTEQNGHNLSLCGKLYINVNCDNFIVPFTIILATWSQILASYPRLRYFIAYST